MAADQKPLRVLGIDPGSINTGFGIVDYIGPHRTVYVASGVIHSGAGELSGRLRTIHEGIQEIVATYQPGVAVVEKVFMARNAQSALKLGQARGVAIAAAALAGITLYEFSARQIKQAVVGKGDAAKQQVQFMVQSILGLPASPSADAADALACALYHCHLQRTGGALAAVSNGVVST